MINRLLSGIPFKNRLWIAFSLMIVLSVTAVGWTAYFIAASVIQNNALKLSQDTLNKSSQAFDEKLKRVAQSLNTLFLSSAYEQAMKNTAAGDASSYFSLYAGLQTPFTQMKMNEPLLQSIANMLLRTLIEKLPYEDVAPMEEWLREMHEAGGRSAHSIYELLRRLCTKGCELVEARSASHAHLVVEQAVAYIRNHLSDDLTVARCAAEVHLSGSYFANLFKKVTGTSFNQYVTGLRIDKAKEMLLQGMQIQEIASALGYEERRYFSDVFKKVTGMTPSEYRQSRQT